MIDVRSPKEFTGEKLHMEDYPQEGALRGGHIPGARTSPGAAPSTRMGPSSPPRSCGASSRRRSASSRMTRSSPTAASASASSLTWFVLTYLLGYPNVKNYDGSWTEWGNLVRAPIAKGA